MYYNFHGLVKKKIKDNQLISFEFLNNYHKINNVLLLSFKDGSKVPIREYRWLEYLKLIEEYYQ